MSTSGSFLMTQSLVEQALATALPMIQSILDNCSKREGPRFVHIVVLDLNGEKLLQRTEGREIPHRSEWKNDYDRVAGRKAGVSHRLKMDTSLVATGHPALFELGDTHWEGGVYLGGIAVGVSGIESYLDEVIARVLASVIMGLIKEKVVGFQDRRQSFFGLEMR